MSCSAFNAGGGFPTVRACIFDVDGLLINSEDIYTELYNSVLHEFNRPDLPWTVKARQQSRGRQGGLRLLEWAQLPISLEEFNAKVAAQRELFRKSQILPGVSELLNSLCKKASSPVQISLASSSGKSLFDVKTAHLPTLTSAFPGDCRVFGDDAAMSGKSGKPAPDIFLLALQRINNTLSPQEEPIKPEECLVFEDSVAGVEAGRRAGMRVIWVPHTGLLDVCRGREEMVLTGTTEQHGDGLDFTASEDVLTPERENREQKREETNFPGRSKDGWAELLTSLENFPYDHYGIRLRSS